MPSKVVPMSPRLSEDGASTGINLNDAEIRNVQLDMRFDGSSRPESAWGLLLGLIRAVVDEAGLKQVAYDLDVSPSYLSHCLNERERNNVPAKWLPYFVMRAKTDDIVSFVALWRGLAVVPRKTLTPEQRLQRLEQALAEELGPETRKAILKKAFDEP